MGSLKRWAEDAGVRPERIPGYWQDKKGSDTPVAEKPSEGEKVFYYIHGGGFVALTAHPADMLSAGGRTIMGQCPSAKRMFALEYRLTKLYPETRNPFPAALIDCLMGYYYLVNEVGFSSKNVVFMGDSAGGNLALALVRYLVENKGTHPSLPDVPHDLILLSPWTDLGTSHETPGSSLLTFADTDFLTDPRKDVFFLARKAYCGPLRLAAANSNPYISPGSIHTDMFEVSYKGFPRTLMFAGTAERFLDQLRSLRDKMVRDMGEGSGEGQLLYHEGVDAVHDYLIPTWEEPQRSEALHIVAEWFS